MTTYALTFEQQVLFLVPGVAVVHRFDCITKKLNEIYFVFVFQGAKTVTLFQDAGTIPNSKDLDSWVVISSSELSWLQLTSFLI
jgi:hypothetical protein